MPVTTTMPPHRSWSSIKGHDSKADLHLVVVVDNPKPTPAARAWLLELREELLYSVRVRFNSNNMGASMTRNRCLDESFAEYVIFLDDDVEVTHECLEAYAEAFHEHPEVGYLSSIRGT
jgi:GT2 family glycosyltransferase